MKTRHLHFIGIGGTAMAALARAFSDCGFKVTGSDSTHIFPPMSDYLKKNKIKYYTPFSAEKVGMPAEIVVSNAHYSDANPEVIYARAHKIELEHFPGLVEKYLIRKNSVVVAGTYGKSTITAMLAWLLDKAGKNPNYMLGGIPLNFGHGARITPPTPPLRKGGSRHWSVVEGDEYPAASPWDYSPKFNFYHTKYLILTSAAWDHMDIFKTEKSYLDVFKKLVRNMPKNGLIVAKLAGENLTEVLKEARCKVVYYSLKHETIKTLKQKEIEKSEIRNQKSGKVYFIDNVEVKNRTTKFVLKRNDNTIGQFKTKLLGEFNLENWAAALALACELNLPVKILQKAVRNFKGVKRRLEIRFQTPLKFKHPLGWSKKNLPKACPDPAGAGRGSSKNKITIIDDFAHSPVKAKESVKALRQHFAQSRIFIIFEPNRGGRSVKCLKKYAHVFDGVSKIFIPKLTEYKKKKGVRDVSGQELADYLRGGGRRHPGMSPSKVIYQPNNQKIITSLLANAKAGDIIAFLGSKNFDGMIKELIKRIMNYEL